MQLFELKPDHVGKDKKRVGRGGKRGTTSGRGTKGQKSRTGHRIRPAEKDAIKNIPKLRGRGKHPFKSIQKKIAPVNIKRLDLLFQDGDRISPKILYHRGVLSRMQYISFVVKILGEGMTAKKFTIEQCTVSASAKEKIEKAGGKITR